MKKLILILALVCASLLARAGFYTTTQADERFLNVTNRTTVAAGAGVSVTTNPYPPAVIYTVSATNGGGPVNLATNAIFATNWVYSNALFSLFPTVKGSTNIQVGTNAGPPAVYTVTVTNLFTSGGSNGVPLGIGILVGDCPNPNWRGLIQAAIPPAYIHNAAYAGGFSGVYIDANSVANGCYLHADTGATAGEYAFVSTNCYVYSTIGSCGGGLFAGSDLCHVEMSVASFGGADFTQANNSQVGAAESCLLAGFLNNADTAQVGAYGACVVAGDLERSTQNALTANNGSVAVADMTDGANCTVDAEFGSVVIANATNNSSLIAYNGGIIMGSWPDGSFIDATDGSAWFCNSVFNVNAGTLYVNTQDGSSELFEIGQANGVVSEVNTTVNGLLVVNGGTTTQGLQSNGDIAGTGKLDIQGEISARTPNHTPVYLHLTNPSGGVSTATWTTTP